VLPSRQVSVFVMSISLHKHFLCPEESLSQVFSWDKCIPALTSQGTQLFWASGQGQKERAAFSLLFSLFTKCSSLVRGCKAISKENSVSVLSIKPFINSEFICAVSLASFSLIGPASSPHTEISSCWDYPRPLPL
jgi:hypothetical protein